MKYLSDNFLTLILAFVLGISPIQSISASASKCMNMNTNMHAQMKMTGNDSKQVMDHSENKQSCCDKNECGTTHCVSTTIVAITSNIINNITYTSNYTYQKTNLLLIAFYPSSLYRPPKI